MKLFEEKPYEAVITVPNIVTGLGLILLIPYVWGFFTERRWIMFICLFLAGLSDGLDGLLARNLKQRTKIGEIIDLARDRFLLAVIFIHFLYLFLIQGQKDIIFWALAIVFFISEFIIMLFDFYWWRQKVVEARTHKIRKVRQAGLVFLAGALFLDYYFRDVINSVIGAYPWLSLRDTLSIMAVISCLTFFVYLKIYRKIHYQFKMGLN